VASRRKPHTLDQVIRIRCNSANYRADKLGLPERLVYSGISSIVPETCKFCGRKLGVRNLSLDHIQPFSKGGRNTWANVQFLCARDNRYKGNFTDEEYAEFLRVLTDSGWLERFFQHYRPRSFRA
jgi:5-methylcytosine-specific restriction endonuclease McrA